MYCKGIDPIPLHPMNNAPKIDETDIEIFLLAKLQTLSSQVPGYVTLRVEAKLYDGKPQFVVSAYGESVGVTDGHQTCDEAIGTLADRTRADARRLREKAAELLRMAEAAECHNQN